MANTINLGSHRLPTRFWRKIEPDEAGCWRWTASLNSGGYGTFRVGGKVHKAHRVAYEGLVGPIPPGLSIDHLCRVRCCVNPEHLEPVTEQVNILRGTARAARNAKVTHCPQGHAYDEINTYVYTRKDGRVGRYCLACRRNRRR